MSKCASCPVARPYVCPTPAPYYTIGGTFAQFGQWMAEAGLTAGPGVALYYDDPGTTPANELRSDAGAFVQDSFKSSDPRVHIVDVPAGQYAVATHTGHYQGLPDVWGQIMKWTPPAGYSFAQAPGLEVYLNDCAVTPADELRTELHVPLTRSDAN